MSASRWVGTECGKVVDECDLDTLRFPGGGTQGPELWHRYPTWTLSGREGPRFACCPVVRLEVSELELQWEHLLGERIV